MLLNKTYEETPDPLPQDYDYIIPSEYCTFHEAKQDENGNWIIDTPVDLENASGDDENKDLDTEEDDKKDNYNYLDANGMPNWLRNDR